MNINYDIYITYLIIFSFLWHFILGHTRLGIGGKLQYEVI